MSSSTVLAKNGTAGMPEKPRFVRWLDRVCSAVADKLPILEQHHVSLWEGGVRLQLVADGQQVGLRFRPRVDTNAYRHTASLTIALDLDGSLSSEAEKVVTTLISVIERNDHGDIELPSSEQIVPPEQVTGETVAGPDTGRTITMEMLKRWRKAERDLKRELHENAFIALMSVVTDDLYPNVMALGAPIPEDEIVSAWKNVDTRMKEGRAPKKLGLYLHVPYCTTECTFCYCGKTDQFRRSDVDLYVERLIQEMGVLSPHLADQTFTSVYFGGGTPSLLTPPAMRRVFTELYSHYRVPEGTQVVFEGNPDSLNERKIQVLAEVGRVTRLTVGIQSLDPVVQKNINRNNTHADVRRAVQAARTFAISHVNFDLIAGLEGQTMASWQADVRFCLEMRPDSLHLNGFRPLPRTNFKNQQRGLSPDHEALRDSMLAWGHEELARSGFDLDGAKTQDADNMQEYNLRRQNSSLVGLGFPARSHAFAGYYYVRELKKGFVPELQNQLADGRRFWGVPVDDNEEMHKYLVTNIRDEFERSEFQELFGVDAVDALPEVFESLGSLGAVEVRDRTVKFHTGNWVDAAVYRGFAYSAVMRKRSMDTWGARYDPDEDYRAALEGLVASVE